jgi:hypothetical protein
MQTNHNEGRLHNEHTIQQAEKQMAVYKEKIDGLELLLRHTKILNREEQTIFSRGIQ